LCLTFVLLEKRILKLEEQYFSDIKKIFLKNRGTLNTNDMTVV
jgi:hypothetical protein